MSTQALMEVPKMPDKMYDRVECLIDGCDFHVHELDWENLVDHLVHVHGWSREEAKEQVEPI